MRHRVVIMLGVVIALVVAPWSVAQEAAAKAAHKHAAASKPLTKEYLQQVMDAWSTMDTSKVAPYYSQGPDNPYFDVTPFKYDNWAEYAKQMDKTFSAFQSFPIRVSDARVHNMGKWAWSTATWHADGLTKDGKAEPVDARWTAIWENRGGKWVIAHDHNSVVPAPQPQGPAPAPTTSESGEPSDAMPSQSWGGESPASQHARFLISPNVM